MTHSNDNINQYYIRPIGTQASSAASISALYPTPSYHTFGSANKRKNLCRTRICQKSSRCKDKANCQYAHSLNEIRSTVDVYKNKICTKKAKGIECKAMMCRYFHHRWELTLLQLLYKYRPDALSDEPGFVIHSCFINELRDFDKQVEQYIRLTIGSNRSISDADRSKWIQSYLSNWSKNRNLQLIRLLRPAGSLDQTFSSGPRTPHDLDYGTVSPPPMPSRDFNSNFNFSNHTPRYTATKHAETHADNGRYSNCDSMTDFPQSPSLSPSCSSPYNDRECYSPLLSSLMSTPLEYALVPPTYYLLPSYPYMNGNPFVGNQSYYGNAARLQYGPPPAFFCPQYPMAPQSAATISPTMPRMPMGEGSIGSTNSANPFDLPNDQFIANQNAFYY